MIWIYNLFIYVFVKSEFVFICYHYVFLQSPLKMSKNETKKKYEVPERCRPPKPKEASKDPTPSKPPPVFVQVGGLNPKEVFVSIDG